MIQGTAVKERLLAARRQPENGGNGARAFVNGGKLRESAGYLGSARMATLNWVRELYIATDKVDLHTEDVREVLDIARQLESLRLRLEAKASVFGV